MPRIVYLSGKLTARHGPVQGLVRCTPERLWVVEGTTTWASLAPDAPLDHTGEFAVALTPTDTDAVPWHYLIETPAGAYRVELPWREQMYHLRELIDAHRAVPRTPH